MGKTTCVALIDSCSLWVRRLLSQPFDFSQAFDQALKNIIVALPNRPARESSDDAVSRISQEPLQAPNSHTRCIIARTLVASENSPATLGPLAPTASITWYPWKE